MTFRQWLAQRIRIAIHGPVVEEYDRTTLTHDLSAAYARIHELQGRIGLLENALAEPVPDECNPSEWAT